ncbi:hypothetical protein MNBD_GAMMA15-1600 [hydrothermal vent metagenome]|uniref:Uncharacterized protein n=1 Tax=hydrothermal vent metagenome TaxID=652676 RepID=A0A3B0YJD7_9ZZZZ
MTASRQQQCGAVTLVGALFIVVVLSLMAASLLRMAGSNILDSALHNDAVEALFITETGIEHASFLYAGTGNCPGLAGTGPVNTGRGSFSLVNAVVQAGGDCRVTVTASVSSAPNAAPAVRTVEADLRLSGGSDGWIVGDNGTILRWDGASWNAFASPTTNSLFDVHCVNTADCKAVGENGTIIHWDGTAWSTFPSNTGFDLLAISCEPDNPDNCFASGGFGFTGTSFSFGWGIIQRWNGGTWTNIVDTTFQLSDWRFNDLSCPSTTCYVVTANGLIGRYDPGIGNWVNDISNTGAPLNGISCTADNYCWAVGTFTNTAGPGGDWNLDFRNAANWTPITVGVNNQSAENLNSVSCVDNNDCWTVGNRSGSRYVLGNWNGVSWTATPYSNGAQREDLNAVHCLASNDCWAVGNYRNGGNIIHYDGASWAYIGATVANNTDLNGVHFPSGAGGGGGGSLVTLTRWQEVISN